MGRVEVTGVLETGADRPVPHEAQAASSCRLSRPKYSQADDQIAAQGSAESERARDQR